MPDWGFWAFASMLGLAAKSAKHQLRISALFLDTTRVLTSLEQIGEQTHSIYGAQLPIIELVSEAIHSVRKVEEQQVASAPLLDRVIELLERPGREHAERSLRKLLGDAYSFLTPEAKAAAIEGELRFQQRDCVDASVIPFQLAKAFECQLRANVTLPYAHRERMGRYELTLSQLRDALRREEPNVLGFLEQRGFEAPGVLSALERILFNRNRAAHQACMTLVEAEEIRSDWLGVGDPATSIFYPLVPRPRT